MVMADTVTVVVMKAIGWLLVYRSIDRYIEDTQRPLQPP